MANRTVLKIFRCTEAEAEQIKTESVKRKISESEYMRRQVLKNQKPQLPDEAIELLRELKYYDLKIGTNINQVVRSCNSKKFITRSDYRALIDNLVKLDEEYERIRQTLSGMMKKE